MKNIEEILFSLARKITRNPKKTVFALIAVNLFLAALAIVPVAAQEAATPEAGLKYVGAGIAVAGSTFGAGIALQGATSAGLAAMTEKPGLAVWVLIMAGLGEGVAIYGLIIAILILGA
jgi:V/A-type H+-transporting ATPase subunit K